MQRKIIAENLNFDDIVKHGLAYEQSEKKVSRINKESGMTDKDRVAQLETEVKALKASKLETEVRALKASNSGGGAGSSTKTGPSSQTKC